MSYYSSKIPKFYNLKVFYSGNKFFLRLFTKTVGNYIYSQIV
jgi:hypothetical protein